MMSSPFTARTRLNQVTVNRLDGLFRLACKLGYSKRNAKRIALQTLERLSQGGTLDYSMQLARVMKKTATGGKQVPETYDRLMKGRKVTEHINPKTTCYPYGLGSTDLSDF